MYLADLELELWTFISKIYVNKGEGRLFSSMLSILPRFLSPQNTSTDQKDVVIQKHTATQKQNDYVRVQILFVPPKRPDV